MKTFPIGAGALVLLSALRAAAAPATITFVIDPRIELLSVALLLAEPSKVPDAYAASAQAAFSRFATHPAVTRIADMRRRGTPASALVVAVLKPEGGSTLLSDLQDFERSTRFINYFKAHSKEHREFIETARRESMHALSPDAALAYMGLALEGEHRFILAPLLAHDAAVDSLHVRPATRLQGLTRFGFDTLEGSVALALCREALTWIDTPRGDIPAHVAAAVGLRVIARDLGEVTYAAVLNRHVSENLPHLTAMSEGLKDYENSRASFPTLESFSPQLKALAALRLEQATRAARDGKREEALFFLAAARTHHPDFETLRGIMFLYLDLKETALAKALAKELPKSSGEHPTQHFDRAVLAAKTGDRAAALRYLAAAAKNNRDADARRRMVALYMELKEYGPPRALLNDLIKLAPQEPGLRLQLADIAIRTGDRAAALRAILDAKALHPSPDDRRRLAFLHLDLEDYAPATTLLEELIRERPRDADLLVDLASVLAAAGKREEALRRITQARALSPGPDTGHRILLLKNDLSAMEPRLNSPFKPLSGDTNSASHHLSNATLAARGGDRGAALTYLADALALNPGFEERRLMAALYQELDENKSSADLLSGLIQAAPRDPRLRIDRAALYARAGDRGAALRSLRDARRLNPAPDDRRRMALLHQNLRDYAAALKLLVPLVKEQPAHAALRGDLGLCYYLSGQRDPAVEHLQAAIKLDASALTAVISLGTIYAAEKSFALELAVYDAVPAAGGDPELRAVLQRSQKEARARAPHE